MTLNAMHEYVFQERTSLRKKHTLLQLSCLKHTVLKEDRDHQHSNYFKKDISRFAIASIPSFKGGTVHQKAITGLEVQHCFLQMIRVIKQRICRCQASSPLLKSSLTSILRMFPMYQLGSAYWIYSEWSLATTLGDYDICINLHIFKYMSLWETSLLTPPF